MHLLLLFTLLGCTFAIDPIFHITFDGVTGTTLKDDVGNIPFTRNAGGTTKSTTGGDGLEFDGTTLFEASDSDVPKSCISDPDECLSKNGGTGFTIALWFTPEIPFPSNETEYLIHYGFNLNPTSNKNSKYGFKIGIRRDHFIFEVYGRTKGQRLSCRSPDDFYVRQGENRTGSANTVLVTLQKRPGENAPIYGALNVKKLRSEDVMTNNTGGYPCDTQVKFIPKDEQNFPVSRRLLIGAANVFDKTTSTAPLTGFLHGIIHDMRMYDRPLTNQELQAIHKAGPSK